MIQLPGRMFVIAASMREQPFIANVRGWVGGRWTVECQQQQQQIVKDRQNCGIVCLRTPTLRLLLAHGHCEKQEFSRILVRIESFLNLIFTANIRGFLFILSVVLTVCCYTANMFQKWQEDVIKEGLLGVAHAFTLAFTNTRQEALLATGRRWIKSHCSKLRRRIGRRCGIRPNDNSISVSSFSLLFLLLLAGDVELNPGPTLSQTIVTPIKLEIPSEM